VTRIDLRRNIKASMETICSSLEILYKLDLVQEREAVRFYLYDRSSSD